MLFDLIRRSRRLLAWAALTSIFGGVGGVLVVAQINGALHASADERLTFVWGFAAAACAAIFSRMLSNVLFERLAQDVMADLRRRISRQVISADFRQLEKLGAPKVQSALSEHSTTITQFFISLPSILTNLVVVLGSLLYMVMLSWSVFIVALCVIALGAAAYHVIHVRAIDHLRAASREQDALYGHFRALTEGAKELRLNRKKREDFVTNVLDASVSELKRRRVLGMSFFVAAAGWARVLIFLFIGLVLFALVDDGVDSSHVMTGFALMFVYLLTPIEALLGNIPRINLARVSAKRIEQILHELPVSPDGQSIASLSPLARVELKGVTHRYYHEQSGDFFQLGPIDLTFRPGEIIFLVGGNGSGKTTLAKLLVGLYPPEAGQLWVNGVELNDRQRDDYRQLFSAIFSDFYLFDRLLETYRPDLDNEGNALLERLHLQHKVKVADGAFSTQALSQGQRKRLALVVAWLEDRPFVVFDEWAADQDPLFKKMFYNELLPSLRAAGKTIVVITHDDGYFHLADRLLRLESGQVLSSS